jgi:phospholipid/cholesterol/gamma-HCH transport system substrate-binding protein
METRAKFALIGLFTICVIAAAFGFVFWFTGSRGGANLKAYQVVFDNPVTGLSRGGAVLFNGIRVGEVGDLDFDPKDPLLVVARIDIRPDVPMKETTKARLEFSGLTGVASIQLFNSDPKAPDLATKKQETIPRLRAERSANLQDVLETVQTAGKQTQDILTKVDQIVTENQTPIRETIANFDKLSAALDAEKINTAVDNISKIAAKLDVDKFNHAIGSIDTVVSSLDVSSVNHTLKSVDEFATALGDNAGKVREIANGAADLVASLNKSAVAIGVIITTDSAAFNSAVANLDKILAGIDVAKVRQTIDGVDKFSTMLGGKSDQIGTFISDARELAASLNRSATQVEAFLASGAPAALTRSINNLENITKNVDGPKLGAALESAEKFANALGDSSPKVDQIAKNANELFAKLNVSANKIDSILDGVNSLVNSPDGKSAFGEFAEASRAVRRLADDLDKRSAELLSNLGKFSGSGLRDVQLFAIDGRRALNEVSRTLQGVQRNPQQFIFGGKASLPEYGN